MLPSDPYMAFLLGGCTYVLVFLGEFLLFGKNEQEKAMLQKVLGKLKRKRK